MNNTSELWTFQYSEEIVEYSECFFLRISVQEKTRASYPFHFKNRQILLATYLQVNETKNINQFKIQYDFPDPEIPTMQIVSFTPSPSCINPPSPGIPHTDVLLSRVRPGRSTH